MRSQISPFQGSNVRNGIFLPHDTEAAAMCGQGENARLAVACRGLREWLFHVFRNDLEFIRSNKLRQYAWGPIALDSLVEIPSHASMLHG